MAQMKERRVEQLMDMHSAHRLELPKVKLLVHWWEMQMAMQMVLMKETSLVCQWDRWMAMLKARMMEAN